MGIYRCNQCGHIAEHPYRSSESAPPPQIAAAAVRQSVYMTPFISQNSWLPATSPQYASLTR